MKPKRIITDTLVMKVLKGYSQAQVNYLRKGKMNAGEYRRSHAFISDFLSEASTLIVGIHPLELGKALWATVNSQFGDFYDAGFKNPDVMEYLVFCLLPKEWSKSKRKIKERV